MTKNEFGVRFDAALHEARDLTMAAYHLDLAAGTEIVLFGAGVSGARMSPDKAIDHLCIDHHGFFKIIDIGVVEARSRKAVIFVRPSNHTPCEIHETWNQGEGTAPFKPTLGVLKGHPPWSKRMTYRRTHRFGRLVGTRFSSKDGGMRKAIWVTIGLVVLVVVAAGVVALLHKRRVTASGDSTATVEANLRANLPLGSSRAEVESYLDRRAIQHSYVEKSAGMPMYSRTEFAMIRGPAKTQLIRRDIQILFKFDEHDRLTAYSVKGIYTGP